MCDTFIALPIFTKNGSIILGKNSDREPNEAQDILHIARKKYPENSTVKCTYIEIPQVKETNEVILSKPFWMWGAEMGVNEHGVAIGNEAVFTKIKIKKENSGLTGMDLLRLALERTKTATEALELMIELLEKYTQNACGGYENKKFFYHNSFIISDKKEAYILETADIQWVAKKIKTFGSISNGLSIEADYDLISKNAIDFALKKGWHKADEEFNFAKSYADKFMNWASACGIRQQSSLKKGEINKGNFEVSDAMNILKSHYNEVGFKPSNSTTKDICMHATGILSPSHSVASMVVEIRENQPSTIWFTGTSNPCLSLFKPVYFGINYNFSISEAKPNESFWWKSESLNRLAIGNYSEVKEITTKAFGDFQNDLVAQDEEIFTEIETKFLASEILNKQSDLTKKAFDYHEKITKEVNSITFKSTKEFAPFFNVYWAKQNKVFKSK